MLFEFIFNTLNTNLIVYLICSMTQFFIIFVHLYCVIVNRLRIQKNKNKNRLEEVH